MKLTPEEEMSALSEETGRLTAKGQIVAVDPDVAETMGAFEETALGVEDALDSLLDEKTNYRDVFDAKAADQGSESDGNSLSSGTISDPGDV